MRQLVPAVLGVSLLACATENLPPLNTDFSPPTAPELVRASAMRDRYQSSERVGTTAIYVDSVAVHHVSSEASTIVWKDESGRWQRSQLVEDGPGGLLPVERKIVSNETAELPSADAQVLNRLIDDPDLYDGKIRRTGEIGVGTPLHVMAIVTPYGRTTLKWDGRLLGKSGTVADIVLGHE